MKAIDTKVKTISTNNGTITQGIEAVIWSDTIPASLIITGEDIGLANTVILPGSILMTPEKRFVMGEAGTFIELSW